MDQLIALLTNYPIVVTILSILGSLVIIMTVVAPLTKTTKDDQIIQKIESNSLWKSVWDFLKKFSLIQKK